MGLLIVRHKVKDFATWKKAFDGHATAQPRLFRSADDHNEVVILFDMKDAAAAKKFASSADLKSTMKSAGVVDQPTMHFLEEAH